MEFIVFRCLENPDHFIVTNNVNIEKATGEMCPSGGGIEYVGRYSEMGKERAAFDEVLAKESINRKGFYLFEAKKFAPVPPSPEMPT